MFIPVLILVPLCSLSLVGVWFLILPYLLPIIDLYIEELVVELMKKFSLISSEYEVYYTEDKDTTND